MQGNPVEFSFEMRSPLRGYSLSDYMNNVKELMSFQPTFVSIANHQPGDKFVISNGIMRKAVQDKYPSTYFFAVALQKRFDIEVIPHLICNELDIDYMDDVLLGFAYVGIKKIMALRGDRNSNSATFVNRYTHSNELVEHVNNFNNKYNIDFCIGVAGYPDLHPLANSQEDDLNYLKAKFEAGASFITTQMFIDNARFYEFLNRCRNLGISAPIYPGLKVINQYLQIEQYRERFKVKVPKELEIRFSGISNSEAQSYIGIDWLYEQCVDLIEMGQTHLHFYVFTDNDIDSTIAVLKKLRREFS